MKTGVLNAVAPVLLVRDVVASVDHYRDKLGFSCDGLTGSPPVFAIIRRDGMRLMLKQADDPVHVVPHWTLSAQLSSAYFWVSGGDALHDEFVKRGATIDYGPCDQPYGCREFGIQDVDGHDIAFGEQT